MMNRRYALLWAGLLLVLIAANLTIFQKERIRSEGRTVYLQLAPVDPRSLIQGDYMVLRYALANQLRSLNLPQEGTLVLRLNNNGVASYRCLYHPGDPLNDNEQLLRYRITASGIVFGAETLNFQEGNADYYADAQYGKLRVDEDGEPVLIGLTNGNFQLLGPDGPLPLPTPSIPPAPSMPPPPTPQRAQTIYMELLPADDAETVPINERSLELHFAVAEPLQSALSLTDRIASRLKWFIPNLPQVAYSHRGQLAVELDSNNVVTSAYYYRIRPYYQSSHQLDDNELLLNYVGYQSGLIDIPGTRYFEVPECYTDYFKTARYAELHVDSNADAEIVSLRDEDFAVLGVPAEDAVSDCRSVYLPLRTGSRSGGWDYMHMYYVFASQLYDMGRLPDRGHIVLGVDQDGVGTYRRIHEPGQPVADDEVLLSFWGGDRVWFGLAEEYHLEGGYANSDYYWEHARYAEVLIYPNGNAEVINLRDQNLRIVDPDDPIAVEEPGGQSPGAENEGVGDTPLVYHDATGYLTLALSGPPFEIEDDRVVLNYQLARMLAWAVIPDQGVMVLQPDDQNVLGYANIYQADLSVSDSQVLLPYRVTDAGISFGDQPFVLKGGFASAQHYLDYARYAEVHVDRDGNVEIFSLRDQYLQPLSPSDK
jgi:uncharacterized membrane-anchored protein